MVKPGEVLARLAADLVEALGDQLLSLALHGSWALGDFTPGRSDLDVLAVMATDPRAATLAALHEVHARLTTDFPEWGTVMLRSSTSRLRPSGLWCRGRMNHIR